MRYLYHVLTQHFAKKFERTVLTSVRRDGWEIVFCMESFLLVNAFERGKMAFTSSLTCSVMWALDPYDRNLRVRIKSENFSRGDTERNTR